MKILREKIDFGKLLSEVKGIFGDVFKDFSDHLEELGEK